MSLPETFDDSLLTPAERPSRQEDQLFIVLECDRPFAGGARVSLGGVHEVRIGRGLRREATRTTDEGYTTLHLTLPGRSLSSAHARLVRSVGQWIVEDAGSKNGTFVDGVRVTRATFGPRRVLEVGRALLTLRPSMELHSAPSDLDWSALAAELPGMRTLLPPLAESFAALTRVADSRVPVLLMGETGTGKEVLAGALHALSRRAGPLVAVNCGALSPTLVDAQLFGHARGAFSGATRDEQGLVRSAEGGTLFLDKIGELPLPSQTLLLRIIQEFEVIPVGSTKPIRVDLRVVSATLRNIQITDGTFRSDLYARLAGLTFELPPLRARIEDIGVFIADILQSIDPERAESVSFLPELGRLLLTHAWPHNIRELKQGIQTALVLASGGVLTAQAFPSLRRPPPGDDGPPKPSPHAGSSDEDARLRFTLIARLREHRGNVSAVARAMSKAPVQIHRWMRRFGINPNDFRGG